jgi:hypothetical protein
VPLRVNNVYQRILLFFLVSAYFGLSQLTGWWALKLWNIRGNKDFQDLATILYNSDCFATIGWEIYQPQDGYSCQNYVYGSVLIRILHILGLGSSQSVILGWIALLLVSFILSESVFQLIKAKSRIFLVGLIIVFSPPLLLLIERGNFDWLILLLIYSTSIAFVQKKFGFGFFLLAVSALIKFYTFPLLIFAMFFVKNRRSRYFCLAIVLAVSVQIFLDLIQLKSIYIGGWSAAFGNTIWSQYLELAGLKLDTHIAPILGICAAGVLAFFVLRFAPLVRPRLIPIVNYDVIDYFALLSSLTFIGCYFAGLNHDYRLVFLIPSLVFFARNYGFNQNRIIPILFICVFWFSFNVRYFQPLGDLAINILVVYLVISLYTFLKFFLRARNETGNDVK